MDGFTFFKSYYDSAQHLTDKNQAEFYKLIMDYMFTGKEPQIQGHLMGFWLLAKPNLDTSKNRSKSGQTKSKPNQTKIKPKPKPKTSPLKDKDKDKDKELDTRLNAEAFNMWCKHKGVRYSHQGRVLSKNMLVKHDKQTQLEMVESSIMNNYKGLFEPKKQNTFSGKQPQVGSLEYKRQQMLKQEGTIDAELI